MATTIETVDNKVSVTPPPEHSDLLSEPVIIRLPNRSRLPKPISQEQVLGPPVVIPSRTFIWGFRLLCLIALCASGYLAWVAFNKSKVYGCSGGDLFDCDHVLTSKWANVFGYPVSVPALGMYAATLLTLCVGIVAAPGSLSWTKRSKTTWGIITVAALTAGLAALWFIGLQTLAIGHLCKYCLVAHSCGLALAIAILWKRPLGVRATARLSLLSIAAVATLIGAQLMAEEPVTYKIETFTPVAPSSGPSDAAVDNGNGNPVIPPGQDEDVFDAPGPDDDVFVPPGADDDVFAPPGLEDDVFAPPGTTDDDSNSDSLFTPPVTENDQALADPDPDSAEYEFYGARTNRQVDRVTVVEIPGNPTVEYRSSAYDVVTVPCQIVPAQAQGTTQGGTTSQSDGTKSGSGTKSSGRTNPAKAKRTPPVKKPRRIISVSGGRTRLDVRQWPLLGKPTAKFVFVEMFDYTCPHCRATHHAVHRTMQQYGGDLAVISLPVPLNSACNSTVRQNHANHANACELARIAIATWRVNPSKFTKFHCWLFESNFARTPQAARAYAASLVGAQKLNAELGKPYASQYIAKHVQLYQRAGAGAVPKLMFPRSTIVGQVTSSSTLTNMIERELGPR